MAAVFSWEALMETIVNLFDTWQFDLDTFWKAALILLLGTIIISFCGRFIFGKRSSLNHAISSAIGILFIYAVTVVLQVAGPDLQKLITPLPFVDINGDQMTLFSFSGIHYTVIFEELLSMLILAFLVNLADGLLPKGKNIFSWTLFRIITVVLAYILHLITTTIFSVYLPDAIVTYAPMVLLGVLALLLLTGALKVLVGAALATVNPIIGGLYTFFFANIIGKQITKAVLTTAILSTLVFALQFAGVDVISISTDSLIACVPFSLLLLVFWYIVFRVL